MSSFGFLLIDKPAGITSHDVVDCVRRLSGERRVGHSGTLDPFATGLLIVGIGREATREMSKLVGLDKTYEATFVLGASSDTDDRTGKITPANPLLLSYSPTFLLSLQNALKQFTGEISQIPPAYSAIKIGGKKMYEQARAGKPMEASARHVTIYSITSLSPFLLSYSSPFLLSLIIHCSSGTYIRAIARDLGQKLGTGGYVQTLRRTRIGSIPIELSVTLESLKLDGVQSHLIPISELLTCL